MLEVLKQAVELYVDRLSQQWIVRDPNGNFWIVSTGDEAWERREPFEPTEETSLEPIPGHYRYLFRLPF